MGKRKQSVEAKRRKKKKGRPSLLDLHKRSLRLQNQQSDRNPNPNSAPIPNSFRKYPNRRSTRRNSNLNSGEEEDDDEEEGSNEKSKEKELNGESGSDSDGGESRKRRKIDEVETARQTSNSKATDEAPQGDPSDSGPTTLLPDKKLLVFILDRLQKKDTYAVFSDPVDPEELPDYHDIIKHPMDFETIRKKLDSGAYDNLEQFESDVFLLCSNAMRYNEPHTIYFRQARSIQELAKKDFENLRQASDDNELEPKTVRRGRPPIKNIMKRIGRPPVDRTGSDFSSDATLANAKDGIHNSSRDASRKGSYLDKLRMMDSRKGNNHNRSERNEEYSGSPLKGVPMRNWKKFSTIDENRRDTYSQSLQSSCVLEPLFSPAFEGERKLLLSVGIYMEHACTRSVARFAANLGPIGWEIAAKRIERVLPPGTKFGPGWVGECEAAAHKFHPPLLSSLPNPFSQTNLTDGDIPSSDDKLLESLPLSSKNSMGHPPSALASVATTTTAGRLVDPTNGSESCRMENHKGEFGLVGGGTVNGFYLPTQEAKMSPETRSSEVTMTHSHVLDMVSRNGAANNTSGNHYPHASLKPFDDAEGETRSAAGNPNAVKSEISVPDSNREAEGQWCGDGCFNPKTGSITPDLNVDFHSPGSPVAGVLLPNSKQQLRRQPDLALQL